MKYEYLCTSKYGTYFIPCKLIADSESGSERIIHFRNPETNEMETKTVEAKLVVHKRHEEREFPDYEYGDW